MRGALNGANPKTLCNCGGRKGAVPHTPLPTRANPAPWPTVFQALQAWPPSMRSWSASMQPWGRSSMKASLTMRRLPAQTPPSSLVSTCVGSQKWLTWAVVSAHWTAVMGKPARAFMLMGCFLGVWYSVSLVQKEFSESFAQP